MNAIHSESFRKTILTASSLSSPFSSSWFLSLLDNQLFAAAEQPVMPTSMSTLATGTKLHLSPYAESVLPVIVTGKWSSCPYLNPSASFIVFSPCSVEKWKRAAGEANAEQSSICCFLCCLAWREMLPAEHGNGEEAGEDGDFWNQPSLGKAQENAELQNHRGWKEL